jgi:hypothetical protein
MTPEQFIDKWSRADRTERQAAQEHFIDLCRVLGEPTPSETHDPDAYSFEKGVSKIDGSSGFADVWKRARKQPRRAGRRWRAPPAAFGAARKFLFMRSAPALKAA